METITSKHEIARILNQINTDSLTHEIHKKILKKKIKFPLLEFVSSWLYKIILPGNQLAFLDKIVSFDEIGSYVLAGKILQFRLESHYKESFKKAVEYIIHGNKWYVCDIIGERLMGYALLSDPVKTIPVLRKLAVNENKWIVRSVGVAAHYAAKKGLTKKYCDEIFVLLLSHANTTDFHTKKGIGWGAKTIAKFHPDIITKHNALVYGSHDVEQWFKTKIKIGLSYAAQNSGKNNTK